MSGLERRNAPYAVASLVLGICSLLFGCLFVGLVCGIIGVVLANKGLAIYKSNPAKYEGLGMLNAGKTTSIIGIVFGSVYLVYYIIVVVFLGTTGLTLFTLLDLL